MLLRVLICDGNRLIRDGLESLLGAESDIEIIGTTDNGLRAIMIARDRRPHVVVTGLDLQNISGTELIRRLGREQLDPLPRVVAFTSDENEATLSGILTAGANGILTRDASREELTSAVRAVARGQAVLGPLVTQLVLDWFREHGPHAEPMLGSDISCLTAREREVLLLISRGLSTEDVAERLCVGMATVRTHIYRLRCKLNLRDRAQLVSFAYRTNIVLMTACPFI